jgi:hypothetical protein
VDTTLSTLPTVLGPGTAPFDLRFDAPDGHHDGAHVIQVSNNPYGETLAALGSRPRLDTKQLGVVSLIVEGDRAIARFVAAVTISRPDRIDGLTSWSTPTFEVSSGSPIEGGLDGESQVMDSPLQVSIKPDPVRVRLPKSAIGYSPPVWAVGWIDPRALGDSARKAGAVHGDRYYQSESAGLRRPIAHSLSSPVLHDRGHGSGNGRWAAASRQTHAPSARTAWIVTGAGAALPLIGDVSASTRRDELAPVRVLNRAAPAADVLPLTLFHRLTTVGS